MDIQGFKDACSKERVSFVYFDDITLALYANDASLYQVLPLVVAIPTDEDELIKIVKLAYAFKIPILPRGSATSLAGQTTNKALVIDFTKYFNEIIEIDSAHKWAIVQPGVNRDQLNKAVVHFGLHFAPDPATSSRATFGGMIANNSSGTKSIKYGKTIDHVLELKVLLVDGTILHTRQCSESEWNDIAKRPSKEGKIYHEFRKIIFENADDIRLAFPKVMRRVQGYPLDEFVDNENWNLSKIFCGSEGTLGIILQAKVNLEPIAKHKAAFTLHYAHRMDTVREVKEIIGFAPAAVEMLDFNVFEQSRKHRSLKHIHQALIHGNPEATLSVEFFCVSQEELKESIQAFTKFLEEKSMAYAYPLLTTPKELDDMWTLRKNGLGLIMGDPEGRKPIPFIEDMAIPVEHLADYVKEILSMCEKYGVETILYAHASVGVLHIRPGLNIRDAQDVILMNKISDETFDLVKKYHGSWSGEHGDGRNRGHRLKDFFGGKVYQCLKDVKDIFDEKHLLNPGMIIDVPPMDTNMRYRTDTSPPKVDTQYHYREDTSFEAVVNACSGVGACRNTAEGTMCPTFRATGEEKDSTRGRANALRFGLNQDFDFNGVADQKVMDVLDLCLSCKACKSECPSNVDMAKLKSEALQKHHETQGVSIKDFLVNLQPDLPKYLSGKFSFLINVIQKSQVFKYILEKFAGIDRRRTLPLYSDYTFESWYQKNYIQKGNRNVVALFNDTYINYYEPEIGIDAIRLLDECGYDVQLVTVGCCQRPRISNGFLKKAKEEGTLMAQKLDRVFSQGLPLLVCEPSCTSALIDDLPDLIDDVVLAKKLIDNVYAIDQFLLREKESGHLQGEFYTDQDPIHAFTHCHQSALFNELEDNSFPKTQNGCCGMAGSFGYDKNHYELSKAVANMNFASLVADTEPGQNVIANGFSCRHQLQDFTGLSPKHWVHFTHFKPNFDTFFTP